MMMHVADGSNWVLQPNDLRLVGVTSDSLKILGIVRLPLTFEKHTPCIYINFYVASHFALLSDGLIGLP